MKAFTQSIASSTDVTQSVPVRTADLGDAQSQVALEEGQQCFSPELVNDPGDAPAPTRGRTSGTPEPQDYPGILLIAADAQARRPGAEGCDEDFEFDFALGVILDGVARLHRSGWTSPAT